MKRILLLLFIWMLAWPSLAQDLKKVQLVSSQKLKGFGGSELLRVILPVFSHEGSTLSADSANFNQAANTFEAFGHVVITQPDGTSVYSDHLNYNGNTRVALLTNNVRMVDKDAILTTDFLTYNLATRVGTYTGGGKINNGENIVTSKNGYYFANSRDAYFRYNVIVNSPQVLIKCDTLRYNSESKIAYFYGPTNITGKKDKSNLYTENGEYNTLSDQARFGKNNLYTDGSRSLRGDSLFYDKVAGYGRAIKNITFLDTAQKIILKGNLATYRQADSSTLVTRNAYVVLTTEDSSKVDSIWLAADTLYTKVIYKKDVKPIKREELKSDEELEDPGVGENTTAGEELTGTDEEELSDSTATAVKESVDSTAIAAVKASSDSTAATTTITTATDTAASAPPLVKPEPEKRKLSRKERRRLKKSEKAEKSVQAVPVPASDSTRVAADTTDMKNLPADSLITAVKDTVKAPVGQDTSKTRIVMAFHHVKIFKSDLQAKADSAFYSYTDSTIRCYVNPMIWTQGSQLSADTIYLQLKNKKLDNMLLQTDGFIVNTEGDSSRFNQIKGKVLTGFFEENKLDRIFVDGNAESIYFTREDSAYTGMNRSVSSRMKVTFKNNQLQDVFFIRKPELSYFPIDKIPKDTDILEGFIWKPKERPASKEAIIPGQVKRQTKKAAAPPAKPKTAKGKR